MPSAPVPPGQKWGSSCWRASASLGEPPAGMGRGGTRWGLRWCPLGEFLVARGGTRALLGGGSAGRMQLNGFREQLCSTDGAFPHVLPPAGLSHHPCPCSSPALPAQTGGAPPGLLLGWVGSVPRLCAPSSTDSSWWPWSAFGVNGLQLLTRSPLPRSPQECHH